MGFQGNHRGKCKEVFSTWGLTSPETPFILRLAHLAKLNTCTHVLRLAWQLPASLVITHCPHLPRPSH